MTCEETQNLLNAYVDDELEWSSKQAIQSHLDACAACARAFAALRSLVSIIDRRATRFKAPQHLRSAVLAGIQQANPEMSYSVNARRWVAVAASVAMLAALSWFAGTRMANPSGDTHLIADVVSSHVRSMMADHLTDVVSSDTHNVKPWFTNRLDYSPPIKDLSAQGFPLIGGRMDYLENRPVAALVYQHNQHLINLFVWPASESTTELRMALRGYNLMHWQQAGMTYWLISDLNPEELSECGRLLSE